MLIVFSLARLLCLSLAPVLALGAFPACAAADPTEERVVGRLAAPPRNEASGMAHSSQGDLLWVHDDSDGAAALYAVSTDGALRGVMQLTSLRNEDWEDLAATELDGQSWLLIGDIGDNDASRRSVKVHFVPEPAPDLLQPGRPPVRVTRPAATLVIAYADGARDAEGLAMDATERALYLLSKRDAVPRLYRVALPPGPPADAELRAEFVGLVPHLADAASGGGLRAIIGRVRSLPCALDFARDRSAAVIVTYAGVLLYPRRGDESWAAALARPPVRLGEHGLPQAEAACFSPDGRSIYVASESSRALLRFAVPPPAARR